ncbi:MAG: hypothetical protein ACR2OU_02770, partial [Thermomicrobiales bacterium]
HHTAPFVVHDGIRGSKMDKRSRESSLQMVPQTRFTRRSAFQALVAGGMLTGFGAIAHVGRNGIAVAGSQIEATPPAVPIPTQTQAFGPTIASKAAELGYDADRIFRFVADEVRYEAYAGALRGANGTLWGLAGNSVDKSILLAALLDESQILYRFASGELTVDAKTAIQTGFMSAATPAGQTGNATPGASPAPPNTGVISGDVAGTPSPVDQSTVDGILRAMDAARRLSTSLYDFTARIIQSSLSDAGIELPALPGAGLPESETSEHYWVQIADGPTWTDIDATLPGTERGKALTSAAETVDAIPDELAHHISIRIVAEELIGGAGTRRDAVTWQGTSIDLINQPVAVMVMSPDDFQGVGLTINQAFSGSASFIPCLVVGSEIMYAETPVVVGATGEPSISSVLSADATPASSAADGELVGLWLNIDITSPGSDPVAAERALLDRVGFVARTAENIDWSKLTPIHLVKNVDTGLQVIAELSSLTLLACESSIVPGNVTAANAPAIENFGALHLIGPSFAAYRHALGTALEQSNGSRSFVSSPNLVAFSIGQDDPSVADGPVSMSMDILHRQPTVIPTGETKPEGVHPLVRAGVLDQVAEQVLLDPVLRGATEPDLSALNVGTVFAEAAKNGVAIVVVNDAASLGRLMVSPEAERRISKALETGLAVIVPEQPVEIAGHAVSAWWLVDPLTGRTRDETEQGRGFASGGIPGNTGAARFAAPEYGLLIARIRVWAGPYAILGRCLAIVAAAAANAADYSGTNNAASAFIETFKNVDPNAAKGCV